MGIVKTSSFPALSEGEVRPCVLSGLHFFNWETENVCVCAMHVCVHIYACVHVHMFQEQPRLLLACPLSSLGRPRHKEPFQVDVLSGMTACRIRDSQRGIVCFRLSCGLWLHLWAMPLTDVGRPIPNVDGMVW